MKRTNKTKKMGQAAVLNSLDTLVVGCVSDSPDMPIRNAEGCC